MNAADARKRILDGVPVTDRNLSVAGIPTAVLAGGTGTPLLLLHSSGEFAPLWAQVIPGLVDTHQLVVPDLPGHGGSGMPDGRLDTDRMLGWLGELIDQTCPSPPTLVGHGLGGALAARFAAEHSGWLSGLVLVDSLGLAEFQPAPSFAQAMQGFLEEPTAQTRDGLFDQCFVDLNRLRGQLGEVWEAIAAYALDRARTPDQQAMLGGLMPELGAPAIPPADLARIAVPVTLIWGRHDLSVPLAVAEAASGRHGWPLRIIEHCGDDPAVEQPEAFERTLRGALTGGLAVTGLTGGPVPLSAAELAGLAARAGRVLRPGEPGWDDAVQVWNGAAARTPALVVQPATAAEVAAAVRFASEHRLRLSIKSGGHHIAGISLADGGLALDLSRMREITVDPAARVAEVGPGCRLQDVDRATQAHGLATVLGFISEVGVAGLVLGGGLGYLTRRFGWSVDNLAEVEIVTADGEVRTASPERHPDLFWAVRGAGANFGVVTRLTLRLHEVGPTVYGGLIAWPFDRAGDVLPAYRRLTAAAPRELAVWLVLLRAPAAPFVPEPWHGRPIVGMVACYSGDPSGADEALAPIKALGDPVFDLLAARPYVQMQSFLDATEPKGNHYYWKTEYLAELDDDLLWILRDLLLECPIPDGDIGVLHLGGALNGRAGDDGAVGNRDVQYVLGIKGMWGPEEPAADRFRSWVQDAGRRVRPFATGSTYINFQTADEDQERVRAAYGANVDRLLEVKRKYDPHNLFRVNRNLLVGD